MAVYLILQNGSHDPVAEFETRNTVADRGHLARTVEVRNKGVRQDLDRVWSPGPNSESRKH
jgi:hypothetical protein